MLASKHRQRFNWPANGWVAKADIIANISGGAITDYDLSNITYLRGIQYFPWNGTQGSSDLSGPWIDLELPDSATPNPDGSFIGKVVFAMLQESRDAFETRTGWTVS